MKTYIGTDELIEDLKKECPWHPSLFPFSDKPLIGVNDQNVNEIIVPIYADCHIYGYAIAVFEGYIFVPFRDESRK
jgi:hypothetical protein